MTVFDCGMKAAKCYPGKVCGLNCCENTRWRKAFGSAGDISRTIARSQLRAYDAMAVAYTVLFKKRIVDLGGITSCFPTIRSKYCR